MSGDFTAVTCNELSYRSSFKSNISDFLNKEGKF